MLPGSLQKSVNDHLCYTVPQAPRLSCLCFISQSPFVSVPHPMISLIKTCINFRTSPCNHKAQICVSSVHFSRSVMSDSLQPHESQHARPPCPTPTPRVHSDSRASSVMPSSHLVLCHPLLLLPPIPPSIRVFSSESTLRMRWPKYWSFSFSIIPSKEHPGLISFRMDGLISLQSKELSRVFLSTTV